MRNLPKLALLRTQQAAEICRHFALSDEARPLLASFGDVSAFLAALLERKSWRDAALLLAHGMPKRCAVWWAGIVCRRQMQALIQSDGKSSPSDDEVAAIEAAMRWVRVPSDPHRLAACEAAIAAGNRSPAHWVAMAAFWSAGNMTPDSGVVTPPPPFLYAVATVSALEFAAARDGRRDDFFAEALQRGISLASGGDGCRI
jgi:hypothetical protein